MARHALHGLDRGPAHQPGALFICGTRDVNPAGAVVFDLLRRRLGPSGWGLGPGSGAARPRSGRRAWMPTPGLTHHRRRCGEDHSAADHRRGMTLLLGGWACSPVSGCVGRPCLSGCSATEGPATRWRSGCLDGVRPLVLGRLFRRAGRQQQGCRELTAGSSVHRARHAVSGAARSGGGDSQAAGARTWSSRLRSVWWQRRASFRAMDSNAS